MITKTQAKILSVMSSCITGACNAYLFYYALAGMSMDNAEVIAVLIGMVVFILSIPIFYKYGGWGIE